MKKKITVFYLIILSIYVSAQCTTGEVTDYTIISDDSENFGITLTDSCRFQRVEQIFDVDSNGVKDLIASAYNYDDKKGALFLILLDEDKEVLSVENIITTEFYAKLDDEDLLGVSIENLGDINGDGIEDIVVTANLDDDGYFGAGALYVIFLDKTAHIGDYQKISAEEGGLTGLIRQDMLTRIENIGDINDDGINDILVGAFLHNRLFLICLDTDGTVKEQEILDSEKFGISITDGIKFGFDIGLLGDINGDGVDDLAIGAVLDTSENIACGSIHILLMNEDRTVQSRTIISRNKGGFYEDLTSDAGFGTALDIVDDMDGDGINEILVRSNDDEYEEGRGTLYILYLNSDGSVKDYIKIESDQFPEIETDDYLGASITTLGDIDYDGITDFGIGSKYDGAGTDHGGVFITNFCGIYERYSISGSVTAGGELVTDGTVNLYQNSIQENNLVETYVLTDRTFSFEDITYGEYLLEAVPGGTYADNYITTIFPKIIKLTGEVGGVTIRLETNTSVEEETMLDIIISPNPTDGFISISGLLSESIIQVINVSGYTVKTTETNNTDTNFDLSGLSTGVYYIKVITENGVTVEPIILK